MKLAAIDIGSNAARLLITEVIEEQDDKPVYKKLNLVRVPLRLGFDVFETGLIPSDKQYMMVQTLKAFRHLLNVYEVDAVKACATSAMRDAKNTPEVLKKIEKETGLQIEVISGDMEANLVYENHVAENMSNNNSYLYVDVGGGSTELSFFSNSHLQFKKSYNIGTIRLLKGKVKEAQWDELKHSVRTFTKGYKNITAIGSGGNINKVFSLSKKKEGKPLHIDILRDYYYEMNALSVEDRIRLYNLRNDRADVIVPALLIYINIMRWAGAEDILVPKIGLADGLIHHLWDEIKAGIKS